MNRIAFLCLILISYLSSCNSDEGDGIEFYDITFVYINDTFNEIALTGACGFDIDPIFTNVTVEQLDTLILKQTDRMFYVSDNSTVDDFSLFFGMCYAIYGDSIMCDIGGFNGIRDIDNYESRVAITDTEFELTYRFTQETQANAGSCD